MIFDTIDDFSRLSMFLDIFHVSSTLSMFLDIIDVFPILSMCLDIIDDLFDTIDHKSIFYLFSDQVDCIRYILNTNDS